MDIGYPPDIGCRVSSPKTLIHILSNPIQYPTYPIEALKPIATMFLI
jgi:hypothetical protein